MTKLRCASRELDLSRAQIMGVLNVTPDSFSDGGRYDVLGKALARAEEMVLQGASIIDVGGESTRPGATKVGLQEEMDRVCPVVERLQRELDVVVSVDTSSPEVMTQVLGLGVGLINDVRSFSRDGALEAVAGSSAALCVMHMQGEPGTMQHAPRYHSVVEEVLAYLEQQAARLIAAGVDRQQIVLDPGFGFGKTLEHNLQLLNGVSTFSAAGYPVLAGLSRKSMIGAILDKPVDERVAGSVAAALIAVQKGAAIVRVHDVAETVDAIKIWEALNMQA